MNKGVKITIVATLLAGVAALSYKGVSLVNKLKQAPGNINFNASFLRIHGLIGEGLTKFISPTIRVFFNLNLKNFSGFDIEATKIYARVETSKAGSNTWDVIATSVGFGHNSLYQEGYLKINLNDGKEDNWTIYIDFKGITTISSLINKTNRHRIVITYNYMGQQLQMLQDVDIAGPIATYWAKAKNSINSLKGANESLHLTA